MRGRRRPGRHPLGATFLVAVTAVLALGPVSTAAPPWVAATPGPTAAAASVELVSQTPTVASGGTFELWVRLAGLPEDGLLQLVLHGRVRSRSELAASMEGNGLRTRIHDVTQTMASAPLAADGSRHLSLSLDPAVAGGIALTAPGAYPLEVVAQDATGTPLATLVTHVLVRPPADDESPPLAVAVVAGIDASPALQPDGSFDLRASEIDGIAGLVTALAAVPDAPATLAVTPETLDALTVDPDPAHAEVLDLLRVAATHRSVLARPYEDVSPDVLADAGLAEELTHQLERGRVVLANAIGADPTTSTWLAGPDLDRDGLRLLAQLGVRHVVVDPDRLAPLRKGIVSLSLAQPFVLSPSAGPDGESGADPDGERSGEADAEPAIDAVALDPDITARLDTSGSAGLEVSRLLAELAVLWFEQPGIRRGVVVPVDGSVRGEVVQGLLGGLQAGGIFRAVDLDGLFSSASPLRQPGGGLVDRALVPRDDGDISRELASELRASRSMLASFTSLVGADSPRSEPIAAQLLAATARGLDRDERRSHVAAARAAIDAIVSAVSAPDHETVTLTARDGTVPLTLRNDAGVPIHVVVRLRSPKLEFPSGDTIPITLTDPMTRLDIAVRARASGAFPLEVDVISPDGGLTLARVDYSVQSTAVSGVGVVLSAGAAFFLLVWWARHWSRTRRSRKLVTSAHPAHVADRAVAEVAGGGTEEPSPQ